MSEFLTFELTEDNPELKIFGSKEGLESLIRMIEKVIRYEDHEHLMTPSWSGYELSEEPQGGNTEIINHVKIVFCKDE